jgi:chemotaxis protein methyltransferase CheR
LTLHVISQRAFEQLQKMFHEVSGIDLAADKQLLVQARLGARIDALELASFDEYCRYLLSQEAGEERQTAIDLLTTNETYFFREPDHFEQLGKAVTTRFKGRPVRLWCAACSSGEEAYSIAMTLLDRRPDGAWELRASDLSSRMIDRAREGIFPLQRIDHIPPGYLQRFCMRGKGAYAGTLRVNDEVRRRVHFFEQNLLHDLRPLGLFDVIFLRNVLIYFDTARKQDILLRLLDRLRPQGLLFVGHAEPLQGLALPITRVDRALFEKP